MKSSGAEGAYIVESEEGHDGPVLRPESGKELGGLALAHVSVEPVRARGAGRYSRKVRRSIDVGVEEVDREDDERACGQHQRLCLAHGGECDDEGSNERCRR
jgi:hypothetical protein